MALLLAAKRTGDRDTGAMELLGWLTNMARSILRRSGECAIEDAVGQCLVDFYGRIYLRLETEDENRARAYIERSIHGALRNYVRKQMHIARVREACVNKYYLSPLEGKHVGESNQFVEEVMVRNPKNAETIKMLSQGHSFSSVAEKVGLSRQCIHSRIGSAVL